MAKVILLDAAGTLIHTAEPVGEVYARHFHAAGVTVAAETVQDAFRRRFAAAERPDYSAHDSGHEAERHWWGRLVGDVLAHCGPEGAAFAASPGFDRCFDGLFSHFAEASAWVAFPDTRPFLETAVRSARLAVVSNFDARLPPILEGLGLAPFFETVVTSAEARSSKPDPGIFHFALRRLGAEPGDAIHAGDSAHADVAGARAAGITAFHLQRPRQSLLDFHAFSTQGGI